jgi:dTDP-4-dehydrorhamnose 3,5-epimerase
VRADPSPFLNASSRGLGTHSKVPNPMVARLPRANTIATELPPTRRNRQAALQFPSRFKRQVLRWKAAPAGTIGGSDGATRQRSRRPPGQAIRPHETGMRKSRFKHSDGTGRIADSRCLRAEPGTVVPATNEEPRMEPLGIPGAWVFTPHIHRDDRGSFLELFRAAEFSNDVGHALDMAQANCSVSRRGVIRGIHFADAPPGQAKYITCVSGEVLDVVVDLRIGSPSLGRWEAVKLDDETRRAVYLPEGLGHAFMALSDRATVVYLCSTPYAPGREHGVHPLDPAIGIAWPTGVEAVLSERDAAAPTMAEAERAGLLPDYQACLKYAARLGANKRPADRNNDRLSNQ